MIHLYCLSNIAKNNGTRWLGTIIIMECRLGFESRSEAASSSGLPYPPRQSRRNTVLANWRGHAHNWKGSHYAIPSNYKYRKFPIKLSKSEGPHRTPLYCAYTARNTPLNRRGAPRRSAGRRQLVDRYKSADATSRNYLQNQAYTKEKRPHRAASFLL